jgi:hypothetical protein
MVRPAVLSLCKLFISWSQNMAEQKVTAIYGAGRYTGVVGSAISL